MTSHFEDIAGSLRGVLIEVAPRLSSRAAEIVTEFIDVGEYGLAVETLCTHVEDSHVTVTPSQLKRLAQITAQLEMSTDTWSGVSVAEES